MNKKIIISALLFVICIASVSLAVFVNAATFTVIIHSPANATYGSTSTFINVTAASYGAIDTVIAQIDGTQNVTLSRYLSTNYYTLTQTVLDGHHVIRIIANDTLGNVNSAESVYFTVATPLYAFPYPFITPGGTLNMTFVVPSSTSHAPCGGAHTMDVMSAVNIAVKLGLSSSSSLTSSYVTMDDYITYYDGSSVSFTALTDRNLIIMGGPGVNSLAYYYNSLKDWVDGYLPYYFDMPVTLLNNGSDYLQVWPSGNTYMIEYDEQTVSADYGLIQYYWDDANDRAVLLVGGLGGEGLKAASVVLADYDSYDLHGRAAIIKYYDSDANGYLDTITIVETVP